MSRATQTLTTAEVAILTVSLIPDIQSKAKTGDTVRQAGPPHPGRPTMSHPRQVSLAPRRLLFSGTRDPASQISPGGTRLRFLAPVRGTRNTWIGPVEDPSVATPVTSP
jgi:hypothetical protein